ncbi:hypothetical protein BCR44DRAFT_319535 [Catenaria anguillulae PL171]|uniref:Uncharacterized protein n=1 Tax=Catenaria anguillulae PL171 TaxID=765915 RepID=A0A1Y2HTI9_9FUNG|nr:hypothetical protein BCR44DRAFT_319535 [Catenaria anguillulae PL171]
MAMTTQTCAQTYRMYLKQSFANGTSDFTPLDVTALGAVERLTHMANLALGHGIGVVFVSCTVFWRRVLGSIQAVLFGRVKARITTAPGPTQACFVSGYVARRGTRISS